MALGLERAIAQILEDAGLGTYGTTIRLGEEQPEPDDLITVLLDGGPPPTLTLLETQALTIFTRRETYEAAAFDAKQVHGALHEFQGRVRSIPIGRIAADFLPVPLGRDQGPRGGRWRFSQTFTAVTRRFDFS